MIYRSNACTDLLSQELTPGRDLGIPVLRALMSDGAFPLMSASYVAANYCHLGEIMSEFTRFVT